MNNVNYYNAAIAGAMGSLQQTDMLFDNIENDLTNQVVAFATAVDTAIPFDEDESEEREDLLIQICVAQTAKHRALVSTNAEDYAAVASRIATVFAAIAPLIQD